MPKKPKLTSDQKARRRAARKAEAKNAKVMAKIPLFASQVEQANAEDEYWTWRRSKAKEGGGGGLEAAYLALVDYNVDVWLLRKLAREVMSEADFAIAESRKRSYGDQAMFWKDILLGRRRIVLDRQRISHGWRPCYLSDDNSLQKSPQPLQRTGRRRLRPDTALSATGSGTPLHQAGAGSRMGAATVERLRSRTYVQRLPGLLVCVDGGAPGRTQLQAVPTHPSRGDST